MATAKQKVEALAKELGAEIEEWGDTRSELVGEVRAPKGQEWVTTSTHIIAVNATNGRAHAWAGLLADMEKGLVACGDEDCETCADED